MKSRYTLRRLILLVLLAVLAVWVLHAWRADAATVRQSGTAYTFPETVNTQSGAVFIDRDGTVFLLGRGTRCACLVVYADGVKVLEASAAYGAPFGSIRPDGSLWVGAMDRNQRDLHVYAVPAFDRTPFLTAQAYAPMVMR